MSFSGQDVAGMKKFVSQDELDEQRKQRQQEWEKVRQPEDPIQCPEEVYDPRTLFQQLEDQKQKKQEDFDEQFRMRNQVKGLEKDEATFLNYVSNRQVEIDRQRKVEAASILQEMRDSSVVSVVKAVAVEEKKLVKPQVGAAQGKSQMALLAGAIKRKSTDNQEGEKKRKLSDEASPTKSTISENQEASARTLTSENSIARVIGVLPGLGEYTNDTSDSETSSSDSDVEVKPSQRRIIVQTAFK